MTTYLLDMVFIQLAVISMSKYFFLFLKKYLEYLFVKAVL